MKLLIAVLLCGYAVAQCPSNSERESIIEEVNYLMWLDPDEPVDIFGIPDYITVLAEYLTDEVVLNVSITGLWPTAPIFAEYALLSREFVGTGVIRESVWNGEFQWLDANTVTRDSFWHIEQVGYISDTYEAPTTQTWFLEDCSTLIDQVDLYFPQPEKLISALSDGDIQVTPLEILCTVVAGSQDGSVLGYCGPVNQTNPSIIPSLEDTTVYNSFDECMEFMSTLPLTCSDIDIFYKGNTVLCRELHFYFIAIDPAVHCPHVAPDSEVCVVEDCPNVPGPLCSIWEETIGSHNCEDPVCTWEDTVAGTYLEEAACSEEIYSDFAFAKQMCCVCDECTGIVEVDGGGFARRKGSLKESSIGETTWRRSLPCPFDGGTPNAYLPFLACSPEPDTLLEVAQDRCCACDDCKGVVKTTSGSFQTRASGYLRPSHSSEEAWLKGPPEVECMFETESPGYLGGYACTDTQPLATQPHATIRSAKRACCDCAECSGVTCDPAGNNCDIRKGGVLLDSPSGENSYLKTAQNDCLHISSTLVPHPYTGGSAPDGTGSLDLWFSPDLEEFTLRIEYENLIGDVQGIHIHEPVLFLKSLFVCVDDMSSPCERTYRRGDKAVTAIQTWDELVQGLITNQGYVLLVHTTTFPYGVIVGALFCGGIPVAFPAQDCNIGQACAPSLIACVSNSNCRTFTLLYSLDLCHLDLGRDITKTTPVTECWTYLSLDPKSESIQLAHAFNECIHCCGSCP